MGKIPFDYNPIGYIIAGATPPTPPVVLPEFFRIKAVDGQYGDTQTSVYLYYIGNIDSVDNGQYEEGEGWYEYPEPIYHEAVTHWDDELQEEVTDEEEWWEEQEPIYHEGEQTWVPMYEPIPPYNLEYSTDGENWLSADFTPESFDPVNGGGMNGYYYLGYLNTGDIFYLRGTNTGFYIDANTYGYFNAPHTEVGGNIMSLLDPTMQQTEAPENCFRNLFCSPDGYTPAGLYNAKDLIMPATEVGANCYREMFLNNEALSSAPSCLPAMTLSGDNCYERMFMNCTALKESPILSATTLTSGCYNLMFYGCENLTGVTTCMTSWFGAGGYNGRDTSAWLSGVAPTGVFKCNVNKLDITKVGVSNIPSGWTILTTQEGLSISNANFTFTTEAVEEKQARIVASEPYTLAITSGALPSGVTFDTTNGKFTSAGNQNRAEEKTVVVTATSEHYTASAQFKCSVQMNTTEVTSPTKLIFYGNDIARTRQMQYETTNPITPVFYFNGVPNCIDADATSGTLTSIPENITSDDTDYFYVRVNSSTGHTSPYQTRIDCTFKAVSPAPLDYVMYAPMISKDQYDFTNAHQLTYSDWVSPDQIDDIDCMYFDYGNNIKVENMTPQSVGTSGTWSIWYRNWSTSNTIFSAKGDINDYSQARMYMYDGDLHVYFTSNQGHLQATSAIAADTWYNITFTYNGSEAKLYVNGVLKDSISTALCPTGDGIYFIAGRDSTYMTAARIYNRVLTDAEITQLASEFTPTT